MNSGQIISRYRITGPLGKGGMGVVYLAEDTRLNRPVALKFLPADALTDQDKQRFLNEAQAAALIRHPNICPIYDIEEADGQVFIAMAYLEGETLARRIGRGRLPIEEAVYIAIQAANGLEKAHALGVIHRDIKSGNIILGPDGHVSILDFGLALRAGADRLTADGKTLGTPAYMSPEQAMGMAVDHRSDIWSLGAVLFEMLTGTVPFARDHMAAVANAVVNNELPSIETLRPQVPAGLQRVVATAMAKAPAQRWQSAREMAGALKPFSQSTQAISEAALAPTLIADTHPASIPPPAKRAWRRTLALPALAMFAVLVGLWFYRGRTVEFPWSVQSPREKLVAVLPFEIIGAGADTLDISNGLMEVLTAALSDFERFQGKLVAIPSSEIRRRSITSAAEAKRVYGANLAVTGTAQPLAGKIQFTLQLIDTATSHQIGAKVLEYDAGNPVVSRNRAVDELARLLSFDVNAARRAVAAGETATPSAYAAYLKGRGLLARYDVSGNLESAISLLQEAIRFDPNYALAHSALGEACWRKSRASGDKALATLAIQHGERAVQLDPSVPIVHTNLAAIYTTSGREDDAIRELKEALRLAPGNAEAPRELARVYTALGRFQEAEAAYLQATKSRPTDWYGFLLLGLFYVQQERYDQAIAAFQRAGQLTPDNDLIYRNLGVVYMYSGRYPKAVEQLQRSLAIKSNATTYSSLAATYYLQHRFPEALSAIETAIDLDSRRYYFWGNLGIYCKWTPGSEGKMVSALEKAVELANKYLEVSPKDYDVRADLAEYYARLGNKNAALAQLNLIPAAARQARLTRFAIVYELTQDRAKAIQSLAANVKNPATLHQIKDDPDLAALWSDPALQKAIGAAR